MCEHHSDFVRKNFVSMKSGLEGRNNYGRSGSYAQLLNVSMKSGLEGRNNAAVLFGKNKPAAWTESQ